jgi:hypothetical protein
MQCILYCIHFLCVVCITIYLSIYFIIVLSLNYAWYDTTYNNYNDCCPNRPSASQQRQTDRQVYLPACQRWRRGVSIACQIRSGQKGQDSSTYRTDSSTEQLAQDRTAQDIMLGQDRTCQARTSCGYTSLRRPTESWSRLNTVREADSFRRGCAIALLV